MVGKLIASFALTDACGGEHTLDVRQIPDGELCYSLYTARSHVPCSLGNMQMKIQLPRHVSSCPDLLSAVRMSVNSGYYRIANEEVYQDVWETLKR